MRNIVIVTLICLATNSVLADEAAKIAVLENRVQQLEKRLAALETSTAPLLEKVAAEKRVNQQRLKARERMRKDSKIYTKEQRQEIEKLYQVANRKWRTDEGKESLEKLIKNFDKANRTGCALLYLGQMSQGLQRENYLQRAIADFSDCYYGDGVQVGPYARFYLAYHYKEKKKEKRAADLFKEIATKYPDAIDHKGKLLSEIIKR